MDDFYCFLSIHLDERVVMKNDRLSVDRKEMDKFGGDWHETITCEQSRLDEMF